MEKVRRNMPSGNLWAPRPALAVMEQVALPSSPRHQSGKWASDGLGPRMAWAHVEFRRYLGLALWRLRLGVDSVRQQECNAGALVSNCKADAKGARPLESAAQTNVSWTWSLRRGLDEGATTEEPVGLRVMG